MEGSVGVDGVRRWPARLLVLLALVVALVGGLSAVVRGGWLGGSVRGDGAALARLELPGIGGRLVSLRAEDGRGRVLPVRLAAGRVWPRARLAQGVSVVVEARFARPSLLGWLFGGGRQARLTLVTPQTKVAGRWLRPAAGKPVVLRFSEPVQVVSLHLAGRRLRRVFDRPRSSLTTGLTAAGTNTAGEAIVAASPRRWEQLTAPVRVGWFPPGPGLIVLTAPRSGGSLHPLQQLRLTFSQPLASVFGKRLPRLSPRTAGSWQHPDSHTLVFQPAPPGFPLAATISLTLPASVHTPTSRTASSELHWQVLTGSMLRLQQLLAQLGYIPLDWRPALPGATASPASQQRAALHPPAGSFHWRYPNTPPQLAALWHPGRPNPLTRAALTAFEYQHGLPQNGLDSADVWKALLNDATADTSTRANGYSYILINGKPPQTLSLWHNGQTLITSRVNAGTPTSPIQPGTYTIWQRTARQTTSGTTPTGSQASQPVSRWLSYYHHDQALHSSNSRSYGHPQTTTSGIELPAPIAYKLWPYTTIGTLLTITH